MTTFVGVVLLVLGGLGLLFAVWVLIASFVCMDADTSTLPRRKKSCGCKHYGYCSHPWEKDS